MDFPPDSLMHVWRNNMKEHNHNRIPRGFMSPACESSESNPRDRGKGGVGNGFPDPHQTNNEFLRANNQDNHRVSFTNGPGAQQRTLVQH